MFRTFPITYHCIIGNLFIKVFRHLRFVGLYFENINQFSMSKSKQYQFITREFKEAYASVAKDSKHAMREFGFK